MNLISKKYQTSRSMIKSASFLDVSPTSQSVEIGHISEDTDLKFSFQFSLTSEMLESADDLVKFEKDAEEYVKNNIDDLSRKITEELKSEEEGFVVHIFDETTTKKYSIESSHILLSVDVDAKINDLNQITDASDKLKDLIENEIPGMMVKSEYMSSLSESSFEEDETDARDFNMSEKLANLKSVADLYKIRYNI